MSKHLSLWIVMLSLTLCAWAQDNSAPQTGGAPQDSSQQPAPAYGQDNPPIPISENPPLSSIDLPGLEPHAAPLSYLQPGVVVGETVDSNIENTLGQTSVRSISEALGTVTLQRLWSHYDLALNYLGGAAYYNTHGVGWKLVQDLEFQQKITWRRGQLAIRDAFSYLPQGNFGGEYGISAAQGIAPISASGFGMFWGGNFFGSLGQVPRISNLVLVDAAEDLNPKSALTVAAGYAVTHFTENPAIGTGPLVNNSFLGSSQLSVQTAYNRILSPHDQIALVYGYQGFDFSAQGTAFHSHVIQAMYGHRVSGRMDFLIGAGPQITSLSLGTAKDTRIGVAGRALFRYRFRRTMMELMYDRYETSGSGLFAGAQTDIARMALTHPIGRKWSGFADLGYSRNNRLQPLAVNAVLANTFTYGFAGVGVRHPFGRTLALFVDYQFNELAFDSTFCLAQGVKSCNRMSQRHIATIGLQWTPRPIRID